MSLDLNKMSDSLDKALSELTPEEIEKFFPKDTKPKGWISIEEHLPVCYAIDFINGIGTRYKVKDNNGNESESFVVDSMIWYYEAKEEGITHWWND